MGRDYKSQDGKVHGRARECRGVSKLSAVPSFSTISKNRTIVSEISVCLPSEFRSVVCATTNTRSVASVDERRTTGHDAGCCSLCAALERESRIGGTAAREIEFGLQGENDSRSLDKSYRDLPRHVQSRTLRYHVQHAWLGTCGKRAVGISTQS